MEKSAVMKRVSENIKRRLEDLGWSHADLAAELGQHRSQVSRMLRGENSASVDYVERVAGVLGVDVGVLFAKQATRRRTTAA